MHTFFVEMTVYTFPGICDEPFSILINSKCTYSVTHNEFSQGHSIFYSQELKAFGRC